MIGRIVSANSKITDTSAAKVLTAEIQNLQPAYFALVMATGIVAIAAQLEGMGRLAEGLTWLNIIAFVVLWALTFVRIAVYPRFFFRDLIDHRRGVGFFTLVAGSDILGSDLVVVLGEHRVAFVLWFLSGILWILLTYSIFTAFTVKQVKPSLAEGINGGWLIAIVATQAVSGLASLLAPESGIYVHKVLFLALSLWLCGGMLYIWLISLIFYRYTFFTFSPSDLMPPYWVNMGAVAISTLAGALLVMNASRSPFLEALLPFLKGFTILFWATATWWIPMLVTLGFWRHVYKRYKLVYDALLGRRLSLRDVYGLHLPPVRGHEPEVPFVDPALFHLHCARRMVCSVPWASPFFSPHCLSPADKL